MVNSETKMKLFVLLLFCLSEFFCYILDLYAYIIKVETQ